jgi:predicted Fe-S protein YdhL (DUF1289 family)
MGELKIKNPCMDHCKFNSDEICKGCGRTRTEVKRWKKLSDEDRDAINRRVRQTHGGKKKKK